ncbi:hypothetical protein GALMADRAFT_148262 [Galerina marginata CBS 339.88]|uniref:Uncharacterized protein n=1 Tax=Galerina marginata (strain CBS 339.88) TaxID=685588 RepID=A0A067S581_GALM3|nr:hypothetical protein GALMADRAFT_148262 [Galerina marginata CBS 339.88]
MVDVAEVATTCCGSLKALRSSQPHECRFTNVTGQIDAKCNPILGQSFSSYSDRPCSDHSICSHLLRGGLLQDAEYDPSILLLRVTLLRLERHRRGRGPMPGPPSHCVAAVAVSSIRIDVANAAPPSPPQIPWICSTPPISFDVTEAACHSGSINMNAVAPTSAATLM